MGLITSLRSKYELYRLEQRYTRREKRTTFASGATYVDGEYVYRNGRPPLSPGEGAPNDMDYVSSSAAGGEKAPKSPAMSNGMDSPRTPEVEGDATWGRVQENVWGAR